MHVLAGTDARTCGDGCTYLQGQIFSPQTFTMTDANVCGGGCKRLRERLQTFAPERGKNDTGIVSPVLDERKGGSIRHSRQPKKREKGKRMSELTIKVHTKEDCGHMHHMML